MLIVTPNLCFDRTVTVPRVEPGGVVRARSVRVTAGGKGVNVARVLRAFGSSGTVVGAVARPVEAEMAMLLGSEGADYVLVPVSGDEGRWAMIFLEEEAGHGAEPGPDRGSQATSRRVTVVNERGSELSSHDWAAYLDHVERLMPGRGAVTCSGSLPPGVPVDGYAQVITAARAHGLLTILDTAPVSLSAALTSQPDLVTPNLEEAEAALARDVGEVLRPQIGDIRQRAVSAAASLVEAGARRAAVTAGAEGVAFAGISRRFWLPAVPVDVVSAVGAGDSFVAGVLLSGVHASSADEEWVQAVAYGSAIASASCEQMRAGGVDPARARLLAARITPVPVGDRG